MKDWNSENTGKIYYLRQFVNKVKELKQSTLIYLTSIIQRGPIELNSSTLTEDQLFEIARNEGKMNIKIPFTNSLDDNYIYYFN